MTTLAPVKPEHVAAARELLSRIGPRRAPSVEDVVAQALADAEARVWQRIADRLAHYKTLRAEATVAYPKHNPRQLNQQAAITLGEIIEDAEAAVKP